MKAIYKVLAYAAIAGSALAMAAPAHAICDSGGNCLIIIYPDGSFIL